MGSQDKAAVVYAIAITATFLAISATLGVAQDASPAIVTPPKMDETMKENMMKEESMKEESMKENMMQETKGPQTHIVDIPAGTSVPGCEEDNTCYLPADITIDAGDTVEWINDDTAAHTVTSGSPTNGPSGVFDSSLVMADAAFAFTFEDTGDYDYFCIVHPWMLGNVSVN